MIIVDDPTLALITRFVGDTDSATISDAEFLRQQLAAIERYVDQYPPDQKQARALEWIETHAQHYRQQWQKQVAVGALGRSRCPDCPLRGGKRSTPCAVHGRWLELLSRYAATEISSREYVEDTLNLLGAYKDRLKVNRTRPRARRAATLSQGAT